MKKYLTMFMVTGLMLGMAPNAFAQNGALGGTLGTGVKTDRIEARTAMQANIEAMKANRATFVTDLQARKAEFQANITTRRTEFRGRTNEMLSQRFEVAVRNLERLHDRIVLRVEKADAEGRDTTDAKVALAKFQTDMATAKAKIAEVKALVPTTDEKVTADIFANIKLGARDAKDSLKLAHQDLVSAIISLKATTGTE